MKFVILIKWVLRSWPILVPLLFAIVHYLVIENLNVDILIFNKRIALFLQVTGGFIILLSINSTIGSINNSSLFTCLRNYLKSIPVFRKNITLSVQNAYSKHTADTLDLRQSGPTNTIEEKVNFLQIQLDWLKEDFIKEVTSVKNSLSRTEQYSKTEISKINEKLGGLDKKVSELSIGSIKTQILGVLLMLHGAVSSYYA